MNIIEFITNNIPTFLTLVTTGIFTDILAGLLGVGGGIVIVPSMLSMATQKNA